MWLIASLVAINLGIRFILILALLIPVLVSESIHFIQKQNKYIPYLVALILIIPSIYGAINISSNMAPSVSDSWVKPLEYIKENTPENSIITSWWDYGYWFTYFADRGVTFDGGSQVGYNAYWVGNLLLNRDEIQSANIIKMLNCGQNSLYESLEGLPHERVSYIHELNSNQGLECSPPEGYLVTSRDMISKASVWGHFGLWDFTKSYIFANKDKLSEEQLAEDTNLEVSEVRLHINRLNNQKNQEYIADWPQIYSQKIQNCEDGCQLSLGSAKVEISGEIVKINGREENLTYYDIDKKEFHQGSFPNLGYTKQGGKYIFSHPSLVGSVFVKLYFFESSQCFKPIIKSPDNYVKIWKVNYDC